MASPEPLGRRPFLGLHVKAAPDGRLHVASVLPGGAAASAGVKDGDFVVAIDGEAVKDAIHLLAISRARRPGHAVVFDVERAGNALALQGVAPPLPIETSDSSEVLLGAVDAGGHRLRTIVNVPRSPGPHPAILYLQGLRGRSCEYPLDPGATVRRLVDGWAQEGLLVLRVERSGVGDSEGPPCSVTGLDEELDGYLAGVDHLRARSDVDASRIFLFGQSFGAMTAPLLAIERTVAGVIVSGASAARWHDCVVDTTRRQRRLAGLPDAQVEEEVARWAELHRLVCREGWTPALVFEKRAHLRVLRSLDCLGETLWGRHVSLYQKLDAIDLFSVWSAIGGARVPTLVLRGEYDWICTREEGEAIVRAAASAAAATGACARYLELARTGHDWLAYDSFEKSRQWGEGRWDGGVVRATQTFTSPQPSGNTQP
jgi:pimeloyl-ACP methyl ester carboxylesterase